MAQGTYTIVINLPAAASVSVGALGTHSFPAGWYAYTGSAFGPGGFARVDRHHRTAVGENDTRHWHVDYLLGETPARIETVVRSVDVDAECAVSRAVETDLAETGAVDADLAETGAVEADRASDESGHVPIEGFGASDCDCRAHLQYAPDRDALVEVVRTAHDGHG